MRLRNAIVLAAAVLIPTVMIPGELSSSAFDSGVERDQVEQHMWKVFRWTGNKSLIRGWWEFQDLRALPLKVTYRIKKNDSFRAKFEDGSSVRFYFIGFALGCPSTGCFRWDVGTERRGRPLVPPGTRRANGEHPGKERGDHYVYTGEYHAPISAPYDPYDPNNWAGPAPDMNSTPVAAPAIGGGVRGGGGGGRH